MLKRFLGDSWSSGTKLMCFSPPVMAVTFAIEFTLAIVLLMRRWSAPVLLGVGILVCLGLFQFSEFAICGPGWHPDHFPAIGFASITMLPMLGLWLVYTMSRTRKMLVVSAVYTAWCAWYVANFLLNPELAIAFECRANYVYFDIIGDSASGYLTYYYAGLLAAIGVCLSIARNKPVYKRAANQLAFGYLSFMVPVTIVASMFDDALKSIPSIMCGFAIVFAIHLERVIVPFIEKAQAKEQQALKKKAAEKKPKVKKKAKPKKKSAK